MYCRVSLNGGTLCFPFVQSLFRQRRASCSPLESLAANLNAPMSSPAAQLMDSGNGMVHYTAPDAGTVYVFDHNAQRLMWSGPVMKGQTVDIDTQRNQIRASGRVVADKLMSGANRHDIFFEASPTPPTPAPAQPVSPPAANNGAGPYNGGFTVTPSVSVQPSNGSAPAGSLTVQPGLNVTPATQPANP